MSNVLPDFGRIYREWNRTLRMRISEFNHDHPDVTSLFFSSYQTFTRVLDDPVTHGFSPDHVSRAGGDIWVDNLHPSTKMHDWIAHDLSKFLNEMPAYTVPEARTE